jgi:DNA end-binding protein Ku
MARPYWSGHIQISLVSFGVSLYVATEAKSQISFHQISRSTGERVRHQKVLQSAVDSGNEEAGAVVQKDEIVKGYEHRKGEYIIIEPSELEQLRVTSKHTIEVSQFIDVKELNPEYVERPYFVTPENDGQAEAFGVVRQALLNTGKAAIGKIAFSGREHVVAIVPSDNSGMMAYTLRYQNELRSHMDYFRDIKQTEVDPESLELADSLIAKRSSKFDLSKFEDGYEVAVKELVEAKVNNLPIPKDEAPAKSSGKVINLMDALRKSVSSETSATPKPKTAPPIQKGIGLVKGASKAPAKTSAKRKSA